MIYKMFAVYDRAAKAYLPPFVLPETGQAERVFADCINSENHAYGKHPEDYTLCRLGNWDDDTGQTDNLDVAQTIGVGIKYLESNDTE